MKKSTRKSKKSVYRVSDDAYSREQRVRAAVSRDSYRRLRQKYKYNYNPPNFESNDEQENTESDQETLNELTGHPEFFRRKDHT